jgi:hypothetical protein
VYRLDNRIVQFAVPASEYPAQPAEHDPQQCMRVRGRADRGPSVGAHPLLVDDGGRTQPVEQVDVGRARFGMKSWTNVL